MAQPGQSSGALYKLLFGVKSSAENPPPPNFLVNSQIPVRFSPKTSTAPASPLLSPSAGSKIPIFSPSSPTSPATYQSRIPVAIRRTHSSQNAPKPQVSIKKRHSSVKSSNYQDYYSSTEYFAFPKSFKKSPKNSHKPKSIFLHPNPRALKDKIPSRSILNIQKIEYLPNVLSPDSIDQKEYFNFHFEKRPNQQAPPRRVQKVFSDFSDCGSDTFDSSSDSSSSSLTPAFAKFTSNSNLFSSQLSPRPVEKMSTIAAVQVETTTPNGDAMIRSISEEEFAALEHAVAENLVPTPEISAEKENGNISFPGTIEGQIVSPQDEIDFESVPGFIKPEIEGHQISQTVAQTNSSNDSIASQYKTDISEKVIEVEETVIVKTKTVIEKVSDLEFPQFKETSTFLQKEVFSSEITVPADIDLEQIALKIIGSPVMARKEQQSKSTLSESESESKEIPADEEVDTKKSVSLRIDIPQEGIISLSGTPSPKHMTAPLQIESPPVNLEEIAERILPGPPVRPPSQGGPLHPSSPKKPPLPPSAIRPANLSFYSPPSTPGTFSESKTPNNSPASHTMIITTESYSKTYPSSSEASPPSSPQFGTLSKFHITPTEARKFFPNTESRESSIQLPVSPQHLTSKLNANSDEVAINSNMETITQVSFDLQNQATIPEPKASTSKFPVSDSTNQNKKLHEKTTQMGETPNGSAIQSSEPKKKNKWKRFVKKLKFWKK